MRIHFRYLTYLFALGVFSMTSAFSQTVPEAPIVPQGDGTAQRPLQAPFILSEQEQAQTDAVLKTWEGFSTSIRTFETKFKRIMYVPSFENANVLSQKVEVGELRYQAPDHGMFSVSLSNGDPTEKWLCDGKMIYEYKFSQKEIDQHTLPPEMQGKGITQGPMPFLFGASAEELKSRYYIRQTQPPAGQERPGQVWIEAFPRTAEDAAEFERAEMIMSFQPVVRPLAIKLHKINREQHVYVFDLKEMKVNKTQILPSFWTPNVADKVKMKLIPVTD